MTNDNDILYKINNVLDTLVIKCTINQWQFVVLKIGGAQFEFFPHLYKGRKTVLLHTD